MPDKGGPSKEKKRPPKDAKKARPNTAPEARAAAATAEQQEPPDAASGSLTRPQSRGNLEPGKSRTNVGPIKQPPTTAAVRPITAPQNNHTPTTSARGGRSAAATPRSLPPSAGASPTRASPTRRKSRVVKFFAIPSQWSEVWFHLRRSRDVFDQGWRTKRRAVRPTRAVEVFGSALYSFRLEATAVNGHWGPLRTECLGDRDPICLGDEHRHVDPDAACDVPGLTRSRRVVPPEWVTTTGTTGKKKGAPSCVSQHDLFVAEARIRENWVKEMLIERRLKRLCLPDTGRQTFGALVTTGHVEELHKVFVRFDADGNGFLDVDEFKIMMQTLTSEDEVIPDPVLDWLISVLCEKRHAAAGKTTTTTYPSFPPPVMMTVDNKNPEQICFDDFRGFIERPNALGVSETVEFQLARDVTFEASLRKLYDPKGMAPRFHPLYTLKAMAKRDALKFDPLVRRQLNYIWRFVDTDRSGRIEFDEYVAMHLSICELMLEVPGSDDLAVQLGKVEGKPVQAALHLLLAREDWDIDSQDFGFLDYNRFVSCWFQVADQFTTGISAKEYSGFLGKMALQLFPPATAQEMDRQRARLLGADEAKRLSALDEARRAAEETECRRLAEEAEKNMRLEREAEETMAQREAAAAEAEKKRLERQVAAKRAVAAERLQALCHGRQGRKAAQGRRLEKEAEHRRRAAAPAPAAEVPPVEKDRAPLEAAPPMIEASAPPEPIAEATPAVAEVLAPPAPEVLVDDEPPSAAAIFVVGKYEYFEDDAPDANALDALMKAFLRRRARRLIGTMMLEKWIRPMREKRERARLDRLKHAKIYVSKFRGGWYDDDSEDDDDDDPPARREEETTTSQPRAPRMMPCAGCAGRVICLCKTDRCFFEAVLSGVRSEPIKPVDDVSLSLTPGAVDRALDRRATLLDRRRSERVVRDQARRGSLRLSRRGSLFDKNPPWALDPTLLLQSPPYVDDTTTTNDAGSRLRCAPSAHPRSQDTVSTSRSPGKKKIPSMKLSASAPAFLDPASSSSATTTTKLFVDSQVNVADSLPWQKSDRHFAWEYVKRRSSRRASLSPNRFWTAAAPWTF